MIAQNNYRGSAAPVDSIQQAKTTCRREWLVLGAGMAVFFLGMELTGLALGYLIRRYAPQLLDSGWLLLGVNAFSIYVVGFGLMYAVVARVPTYDVPQRRQAHTMGPGRLLAMFTACYAGGMFSNLVAIAITQLLSLITGSDMINPMDNLANDFALPALFFYVVIAAPIMEELIFRGVLLKRMRKYGDGLSMVANGLLFGLFHGNIQQAIYAFTIGALLSHIMLHTGKLRNTIIIHAMVNFMAFCALALVEFQFDDYMEPIMGPGIALMFLFVLAVMAIVIIGLVFGIKWITSAYFYRSGMPLRRGEKAAAMLLNPGMLLFFLTFAALVVLTVVDFRFFAS